MLRRRVKRSRGSVAKGPLPGGCRTERPRRRCRPAAHAALAEAAGGDSAAHAQSPCTEAARSRRTRGGTLTKPSRKGPPCRAALTEAAAEERPDESAALTKTASRTAGPCLHPLA